jgi:hypothetical protein
VLGLAEGIVDLGQHRAQRATAVMAEEQADRVEDEAEQPGKVCSQIIPSAAAPAWRSCSRTQVARSLPSRAIVAGAHAHQAWPVHTEPGIAGLAARARSSRTQNTG